MNDVSIRVNGDPHSALDDSPASAYALGEFERKSELRIHGRRLTAFIHITALHPPIPTGSSHGRIGQNLPTTPACLDGGTEAARSSGMLLGA